MMARSVITNRPSNTLGMPTCALMLLAVLVSTQASIPRDGVVMPVAGDAFGDESAGPARGF